MKTSPSPRPAAVPAGWLRGLPPSAAAAMLAAVTAVPAAANAGFTQQASCSVATDPTSDFALAAGCSGIGVTGHWIANAPPYLLLADPGGKVSAAPILKATFAADPGRVFTRVDRAKSAAVSSAEGSGYVQMGWHPAGDTTTSASGATPSSSGHSSSCCDFLVSCQ